MLEKCQKSAIILQFLEGPMFLNPLIYWAIVNVGTDSLIRPEISLLSKKNSLIAVQNSLIAVQNSLLVLRELLRVDSINPWYGGVCPGS